MTPETWKAVSGFEGLYEVSTCGAVRSVDRVVPDSMHGTRRCRSKVLRPNAQKNTGYLYVTLYQNAKGASRNVHKLVADAFIPNPDNLPEVDHVNGRKAENNVENLERVTRLENVKRAWAHGLYPRQCGEGINTSKLSEEDVLEIRRLHATTVPNQSELGRRFSVRSATINSIVKGRSWTHLGKS